MTFVLGINAFHADASAALLKDGVIVGAIEEERFTRIKHWAGFPTESICWCLKEAGITISDVEHIGINTQPNAHRFRRMKYVLTTRPNPGFLLKRWKNKKERNNLYQQLSDSFPGYKIQGQLHFVEHHRAHLASAFFPSEFGNAVVVSVDGFGDFASGAWGYGDGSEMTIDGYVYFPHSLGAFYTAITQYLGFPNYGDEYKVMGLAPYGKPSFLREMREIIKLRSDGSYELNLRFFAHTGKKDLDHQWSSGTPQVGRHWSKDLEGLLGPARASQDPLDQRCMDIARSAQSMYEEAFFHLLNTINKSYACPNVCIAGGCGANSVANGKVQDATAFKNVYVQAAAGDAGGALGAALDIWHKINNKRSPAMMSAYLGYQPDEIEISKLFEDESIKKDIKNADCTVERLSDEDICLEVAEALTKGKVVGWYEGRMEWGPRALGHRSILGDPRRADMKDILNIKIKRRESFRPFAPSVLREATGDWFETEGDVPFMMQVFSIRKDKRELIPAVTHVDGSGRLQTVTDKENKRYYRLIREFEKKTGVPMILNTSFNENEPIVRTPAEALNCFLRTKMDILVIENMMVKRAA